MGRTSAILAMICAGLLVAGNVAKAADQPADVVTSGHKELRAVVEKIDSGMIFMKVPDLSQPRTLSVTKLERLGIQDLKAGDEVSLVIDENNLIIDAHKAGTPGRGHRMLQGIFQEAESAGKTLKLSTADGVKTFEVDPAAVSKVAGLQKGAQMQIELDEANTVIDIHAEK